MLFIRWTLTHRGRQRPNGVKWLNFGGCEIQAQLRFTRAKWFYAKQCDRRGQLLMMLLEYRISVWPEMSRRVLMINFILCHMQWIIFLCKFLQCKLAGMFLTFIISIPLLLILSYVLTPLNSVHTDWTESIVKFTRGVGMTCMLSRQLNSDFGLTMYYIIEYMNIQTYVI